MGIRKYAFGYEMRDGKIQPAGAEAEVVRMLHERYAKGSSYRQLTELLNAGIPAELEYTHSSSDINHGTKTW